MEVLTRDIAFPSGFNSITFVPIGDVHLGAKNCSVDKFKKTIEYIKNTPNVYMIGMGDYIDCIYGRDERFDLETTDIQYSTPEKQIEELYNLLFPINDKIIGLLTGNHEDKVRKHCGLDVVRVLSQRLGVPYLGISAFLNLAIKYNSKIENKQRRIIFYLHHGHFAGQTKGGNLNRLMDLPKMYEADVYLVGHCHQVHTSLEERLCCAKGTIQKKQVIFGLTGSFLETVQEGCRSYSEDKGYAPIKTGTIAVHIKRIRPDGQKSKLELSCSQ